MEVVYHWLLHPTGNAEHLTFIITKTLTWLWGTHKTSNAEDVKTFDQFIMNDTVRTDIQSILHVTEEAGWSNMLFLCAKWNTYLLYYIVGTWGEYIQNCNAGRNSLSLSHHFPKYSIYTSYIHIHWYNIYTYTLMYLFCAWVVYDIILFTDWNRFGNILFIVFWPLPFSKVNFGGRWYISVHKLLKGSLSKCLQLWFVFECHA